MCLVNEFSFSRVSVTVYIIAPTINDIVSWKDSCTYTCGVYTIFYGTCGYHAYAYINRFIFILGKCILYSSGKTPSTKIIHYDS